jgi:hypothetical protein
VMQMDEMLERAKSITPNSVWVIDSTFKTINWGMPLFARMFLNNIGLRMPTFLMLCSDDNEIGQVGAALYLIIKAIFQNIDIIWLNVIVIDKDKTKKIFLTKVILEDASCWEDQESGKYQTKCQLLLCWFHAKKACIENLLPNCLKNDGMICTSLCATCLRQ